MKLRRLTIQNFRNFRGSASTLSFVDGAAGQVRPLTVLVGSNGSGKTTVFDLIEALLWWAIENYPLRRVVLTLARDARYRLLDHLANQGYAALEVELGKNAPEILPQGLAIAVGSQDLAFLHGLTGQVPIGLPDSRPLICLLRAPKQTDAGRDDTNGALAQWQATGPLSDGLLHFPHNRWISHSQRGAIEPPPAEREWIYHVKPQDSWQGSLTQLWVWQNYLDLEEGQAGRKNLAPFVEVIEEILGRGQRLLIRQGRVFIQRPHLGDEVQPDELPAGEQQVLTLFGELARRLRPGAVILIDEIENSLHPALQRAVLYHLRRLAKRYDLQIILASHSMEIVAAVAPHEVLNLDDMVLSERRRHEEGGPPDLSALIERILASPAMA